MKKIINLILVVLIILSSFTANLSLSAAGEKNITPTIHLSQGNGPFEIGQTVTVEVRFNAGESILGLTAKLTYDSSVMEYVSGGTLQSGYVNFVADASNDTTTSFSVSATFKAKAEGQNAFKFSGEAVNLAADTYIKGAASCVVTVTTPAPPPTSSDTTTSSTPSTPTPSDNANLASLKVSGATLSPKFNSNTTSYTATVPFTTDKVTITAGAADGGATFTGAGTFRLEVGDNSKTITVTAASGAKKSYKIVIKRLAEEQGEPEPPVDNVDPLLISAEGTTRKIMQDISSMPVPESFSATTVDVGGIQVGALTELGKRYTLYYTTLEDGSDAALYYKDDNGEYRRLLYIEVNGKFYIIADSPEGAAPSGWYRDTMNTSGGAVRAYRSENTDLKDFYILYCYADASYGFYRFDSLKTTIQRAPDFKLDVPVSNDDDELLPPKKDNIFKKFGNMNPTGKAVIILIGLAIICVSALVVLLILRLTGATNSEEDEENGLFSHDAEEYSTEETINDNFEFTIEKDDALDESEKDEFEEEEKF